MTTNKTVEMLQDEMIDEMVYLYQQYWQRISEHPETIRLTNDGLELVREDPSGLADHLKQVCEFRYQQTN